MAYKSKNHILDLILIIIIVIIGHFSYVHNSLKVVSNNWFDTHQLDSEQLVLDGLLYSSKNKNIKQLGKYSRNSADERDYLNARKYFINKNISGEFKEYSSSFGMQVYFFKFLSFIGINKLHYYHSISAFLMTAVIALITISIKRDFSLFTGLVCALIFLLSPWIVIFAKNLFWLTFTLFLPMAFSIYYSKKIFVNFKIFYLLLFLLFISFLFKFLCGYEFITTIFLSTCAPVFYHGLKQKFKISLIFKKIILLGVIFTLAFIFSITIHTISIKKDNEKFYEPIISIAEKRLWTNRKELVSKQACSNNKNCEEEIFRSLKANSLLVVIKYFLMTDFLPWFYLDISEKDNRKIIKSLRFLNNNFNIPNIIKTFEDMSKIESKPFALFIVIKSISITAFLILHVFSFYVFLKANRSIKYFMAISFFAPISWYFIAKGHSAIHFHMNFILWYIFFVPASIIGIINHLQSKKFINQN